MKRKQKKKWQTPVVIRQRSLGAVIVPRRPQRGGYWFSIRVGRIYDRKTKAGFPMVDPNGWFGPWQLLQLPGLSYKVACYLTRYALDDEELRASLALFTKAFVKKKWRVWPLFVTRFSRQVCTCSAETFQTEVDELSNPPLENKWMSKGFELADAQVPDSLPERPRAKPAVFFRY